MREKTNIRAVFKEKRCSEPMAKKILGWVAVPHPQTTKTLIQ